MTAPRKLTVSGWPGRETNQVDGEQHRPDGRDPAGEGDMEPQRDP
jgi:hypothetical protein